MHRISLSVSVTCTVCKQGEYGSKVAKLQARKTLLKTLLKTMLAVQGANKLWARPRSDVLSLIGKLVPELQRFSDLSCTLAICQRVEHGGLPAQAAHSGRHFSAASSDKARHLPLQPHQQSVRQLPGISDNSDSPEKPEHGRSSARVRQGTASSQQSDAAFRARREQLWRHHRGGGAAELNDES